MGGDFKNTLQISDIINKVINAANIPIIIPSTTNGHLIKLFVAPTYFIIEISFLLAKTVSLIVFAIIVIAINNKIINIFLLLYFFLIPLLNFYTQFLC